MEVLVKSSNGITRVQADSNLLSKRKVFIEGEITPESACTSLTFHRSPMLPGLMRILSAPPRTAARARR